MYCRHNIYLLVGNFSRQSEAGELLEFLLPLPGSSLSDKKSVSKSVSVCLFVSTFEFYELKDAFLRRAFEKKKTVGGALHLSSTLKF